MLNEAIYERPGSPAHMRPPVKGAVASALGWHHPASNELLVSARGLLINDIGTSPAVGHQADMGSDVDGDGDSLASSDSESIVYETQTTNVGVVITLVKPYNHKSTSWTVNGALSEVKGNEITVPTGSVVVSSSAKGEFTITV